MGLNLTLNYLKSSEIKPDALTFFLEVQKQLGFKGQVVSEKATLDDVMSTQHQHEVYLSFLFINENLVIKSDSDFLTKNQAFFVSKKLTSAVLKIEYSDTVMVQSFMYFEKGNLLRELTSGFDAIVEEMKAYQHLMPQPIPQSALKGDVNVGNPLWFEKNGTDPDILMETYGVSMEDIDVEDWTIWEVK